MATRYGAAAEQCSNRSAGQTCPCLGVVRAVGLLEGALVAAGELQVGQSDEAAERVAV